MPDSADPVPAPDPLAELPRPLVVVPYVRGMVPLQVRQALTRDRVPATWWPLNPADPWAYPRLLMALWAHGHGWVNLEQDVVPPAGSIAELADCPEPWCSHAYSVGANLVTDELGLARFSTELLHAQPELVARVVCRRRPGVIDVPWGSTASLLARALRRVIGPPHRHQPDAGHLHRYTDLIG